MTPLPPFYSFCLCFLHLQQHLIWVSHLSHCQTDSEWAQGKFSTLWWKKKLTFWFRQYWHRIRVMNIWSAYGSIRYSMLCCDIELQPYQHFPLVRYSVETNFTQIKSIWWIFELDLVLIPFLLTSTYTIQIWITIKWCNSKFMWTIGYMMTSSISKPKLPYCTDTDVNWYWPVYWYRYWCITTIMWPSPFKSTIWYFLKDKSTVVFSNESCWFYGGVIISV